MTRIANKILLSFTLALYQIQRSKEKKFRVKDNSTIGTMKKGYMKHYEKKGCTSVIFYYKNVAITDTNLIFAALGIKDMDIIVAMENGKSIY
jgi:hypothetical protein